MKNPWTTACTHAFCETSQQGRAYAAACRIEFAILTAPGVPDAGELRLARQETDRRLQDLTAVREWTRQQWNWERAAREADAYFEARYDCRTMIDSTL